MAGVIGTLVEFIRRAIEGESFSEAVIEDGSGNKRAAQWFTPPGIDCQPGPDDKLCGIAAEGDGADVAFGCADVASEGEAGPAEIQIYARNGSGVRVVRIQVFADGTAKMWNDNGSFLLKTDGSTEASGDMHILGALVVDGEVTGNGIELSTHTHGYTNDIFTAPDGPSTPTPSDTDPPS